MDVFHAKHTFYHKKTVLLAIKPIGNDEYFGATS